MDLSGFILGGAFGLFIILALFVLAIVSMFMFCVLATKAIRALNIYISKNREPFRGFPPPPGTEDTDNKNGDGLFG